MLLSLSDMKISPSHEVFRVTYSCAFLKWNESIVRYITLQPEFFENVAFIDLENQMCKTKLKNLQKDIKKLDDPFT